MTLVELLKLLRAKLATLSSARATATATGDLARVVMLDEQIAETQQTLDQLRTLE